MYLPINSQMKLGYIIFYFLFIFLLQRNFSPFFHLFIKIIPGSLTSEGFFYFQSYPRVFLSTDLCFKIEKKSFWWGNNSKIYLTMKSMNFDTMNLFLSWSIDLIVLKKYSISFLLVQQRSIICTFLLVWVVSYQIQRSKSLVEFKP